jgi:hypothetical protein
VTLLAACAAGDAPAPPVPAVEAAPPAERQVEPAPEDPCAFGSAPLDGRVRSAVERALEDERRIDAELGAAMAQLGRKQPLPRIAHAERRHALALERLLVAHGHRVPPPPPAMTPVFDDLAAACVAALEAQRDAVDLYDELLAGELPRDVRCAFERLRRASDDRHVWALLDCTP